MGRYFRQTIYFMEVNFANLVDDLVVVESDEAKAAVPIGNLVVRQHCIFDHAAI